MRTPTWARSLGQKKRKRVVRTQNHKHRWGAPVRSYGAHWVFRCSCGEIGYGVPSGFLGRGRAYSE